MFLKKNRKYCLEFVLDPKNKVNTFHRLPLIVAIKLRFLRFDISILANTYLFYRTFNEVFSIC